MLPFTGSNSAVLFPTCSTRCSVNGLSFVTKLFDLSDPLPEEEVSRIRERLPSCRSCHTEISPNSWALWSDRRKSNSMWSISQKH